MSKSMFLAAARKCSLRATTYLYRHGLLIDEPLIDFSKEPNPAKAHACFDAALDQLDRDATERGATHISYIWEWRA
jgi:hypothetical protein